MGNNPGGSTLCNMELVNGNVFSKSSQLHAYPTFGLVQCSLSAQEGRTDGFPSRMIGGHAVIFQEVGLRNLLVNNSFLCVNSHVR